MKLKMAKERSDFEKLQNMKRESDEINVKNLRNELKRMQKYN